MIDITDFKLATDLIVVASRDKTLLKHLGVSSLDKVVALSNRDDASDDWERFYMNLQSDSDELIKYVAVAGHQTRLMIKGGVAFALLHRGMTHYIVVSKLNLQKLLRWQ